jgi:hypothetical protein
MMRTNSRVLCPPVLESHLPAEVKGDCDDRQSVAAYTYLGSGGGSLRIARSLRIN